MSRYRALYQKQIQELVDACHMVGEKGLTSSVGGNLSFRVSPEHILVTPTNKPKERIETSDICVLDYSGNLVEAGDGVEPTSETPFHTMIMRNRKDVVAAVHAHCTVLSAFAISRTPWLEMPFFPEPMMEIGPIVMVPYVEPSCEKLAAEIEKYVHKSNGFLLQNHGALALSTVSPMDAVEKINMMESMAKSIYMAITMGETKMLTRDETEAIAQLQESKGLKTSIDPITKTFRF